MSDREKKFTPGPWEISPANNYYGYAIAPKGILPTLAACERFGQNMTIKCFNFPGQTQANANLIAAAPELLEALELIMDDSPASLLTYHDALNKAKSAIAKAYGETEHQEEDK